MKKVSLFVLPTLLIFFFLIFAIACRHRSAEVSAESLETDGIDKAMYQEFLMARDPALNYVPTERLLAARDYMNATSRNSQTLNLTWQERGPNNIGGRTRAILIDKRDASGNTVFAASVSGGLFKSTNFTSASSTFAPVNDFLPNLAITCLLQDLQNPNVMFAGTGEGWFNIDAVQGAGIFKSIDGGNTWTQLASTTVIAYVEDLEEDNNGNIYATTRSTTVNMRGVIRSTDKGVTWTQVLADPNSSVVTRGADLERGSNGDMFATLGIFTKGTVWKSSFSVNGANTGAAGTWQQITPVHSATTYRSELAVAPSNAQRLYLMMQDSATDQVQTFYRSFNGGSTWDSLPAPPALNNGGASQTWYNLIGAVDSTNPDVVIVGGLNLARSTDAGSTWTTISTSGNMHVDQHALVFFNSSRLLIGNDGGIYYSTDINNTSPTYTQKDNGFNVTQFYGCDFHPTNQNYFLAGAQDNNTQKFTSAGINFTTPVVGGDGGIPHIRQTDGVLQIAATTNNNYFRSLNSGGSFSSLGSGVNNNRGQFINPTDFDPSLNALFCGDDPGQYYSIIGLDGTPSGNIRTVSAIGSRSVTAVKVDPFSFNTIWIGASLGGQVPMVLKLSNATATPTILTNASIGSTTNSYISSIDVDPANANNILVTLSNFGVISVWESTDGGNTFNNIEGNLPDMPVRWGIFATPGAILSGTTPGGIILGTELGVWTTSLVNGAATVWIANNSGLANVRTDMVRLRTSDGLLVAATHGRGLFTALVPGGIFTGVQNNVITKDFIKYISADENRLLIVKGGLNISKIQVQLLDVNGKVLYSNTHSYQNLSINISSYSRGNYFAKIIGNNKEYFIRQFIKP